VTKVIFGHTTEDDGAHFNEIVPGGNGKETYWLRNLHSVRTFHAETDPPRQSQPTTFSRFMDWFRVIPGLP
jgi:hypothetical protein